MMSISEDIQVRELVMLGYFSKRIVNCYLDSKLDDALGSIAKTLSSKTHKIAWKRLSRFKRIAEEGITVVCPGDGTFVFNKGDVAVCASNMVCLWQIRVRNAQKVWTPVGTDRFQRGIHLVLPYMDTTNFENFVIEALDIIGIWHQQHDTMRMEIHKLKKLRYIQQHSAVAFLEAELRKTSARRYSITYKADTFEVIVTPCARAVRFSARYDDFQNTLSGLADTINSLDKLWTELSSFAKSKGIWGVGQVQHFSEYKWTKLYD